jgi:hypothetical protein
LGRNPNETDKELGLPVSKAARVLGELCGLRALIATSAQNLPLYREVYIISISER